MVKQFGDVACPVQDRSARLRVRTPDTRSIGGDEPDPAQLGGRRGGGHVQAAVRVDYRETIRVAVLRVTQPPPVAQLDHVVFLVGDVFGHGLPLWLRTGGTGAPPSTRGTHGENY